MAASTNEAGMRALAQGFFDAVEAADMDKVASYYTEDVGIWHNFDNKVQTKAENLATLAAIPSRLTDRSYAERRLEVFEDGFVQQHVLRATRILDGARLELFAAIICRVRNGKIVRLDEYLDSAQVAEMRKTAS